MLRLPILYYHMISKAPAGAPQPALYIDPDHFDCQLRTLRILGYRSILPDELIDHLEYGTAPSGRCVMITFDDGHLDNWEVAVPILRRHGFRATVYVVAGAIGGRLRLRSGVDPAGEPILSAGQIRECERAGLHVESHGMTHANLADLDEESAWREIRDSRTVLEAVTGRPVRHFCYPYGSFRPVHMEMVREAGYRSAFSTVRGLSHRLSERFCIKRIPVHHGGSLDLVNRLHFKSYRRSQQKLDRMLERVVT